MAHTQIGPADWPVVARMLRAGYTGAEIARTLGKDPSAMNRHIARNGGKEGYDAHEVRRRKRMLRIAAMEGIRIDERPAIVERRGRLSDFEGDTMQGRDKRVRIVTFVDRRSGYLIAFLLPKMNAALLAASAFECFRRIPRKKRKTITFDNGTKFNDWERLERRSGMTVHFAYPYHA